MTRQKTGCFLSGYSFYTHIHTRHWSALRLVGWPVFWSSSSLSLRTTTNEKPRQDNGACVSQLRDTSLFGWSLIHSSVIHHQSISKPFHKVFSANLRWRATISSPWARTFPACSRDPQTGIHRLPENKQKHY